MTFGSVATIYVTGAIVTAVVLRVGIGRDYWPPWDRNAIYMFSVTWGFWAFWLLVWGTVALTRRLRRAGGVR